MKCFKFYVIALKNDNCYNQWKHSFDRLLMIIICINQRRLLTQLRSLLWNNCSGLRSHSEMEQRDDNENRKHSTENCDYFPSVDKWQSNDGATFNSAKMRLIVFAYNKHYHVFITSRILNPDNSGPMDFKMNSRDQIFQHFISAKRLLNRLMMCRQQRLFHTFARDSWKRPWFYAAWLFICFE